MTDNGPGGPSPVWQVAVTLWVGRRLLALCVLAGLLFALAGAWSVGIGRSWQAVAKVGAGADARSTSGLLIQARLGSQEVARAVGLDPSASVAVTDGPVYRVVVTAPSSTEAIRGANAIIERVIAEEREEIGARVTVREDWLRRRRAEASVLEADAAQLRASIPTNPSPASREGEGLLIVGVGPAERAQARLDRLDERIQRLRDHEAPSPVVSTPGLRMLDRAVGATRLPSRLWWALGSAGVSALVAGMMALVVLRWAREQRAKGAV